MGVCEQPHHRLGAHSHGSRYRIVPLCPVFSATERFTYKIVRSESCATLLLFISYISEVSANLQGPLRHNLFVDNGVNIK